jgi:hypothetical protein
MPTLKSELWTSSISRADAEHVYCGGPFATAQPQGSYRQTHQLLEAQILRAEIASDRPLKVGDYVTKWDDGSYTVKYHP